MSWPESVGKCLADYEEAVSSELKREVFEKMFSAFLDSHHTPRLDSQSIGKLFEIADRFFRQRSIVRAMKADNVVDDWNKRRRMAGKIRITLTAMQRRIRPTLAAGNLPLTSCLARSIAKQIAALKEELDLVMQFQLGQESLFKIMSVWTKGTKPLVSDFVEHLREALPDSTKIQMDTYIAAALVAAGLSP